MPSDRPLLTIAIPTYNRSGLLCEMLDVLAPQLAGHTEVELIISDNASPDETLQVVQRFIDRGLSVRYHRHPENIGSDANFISCFHMAGGRYFWLCGDDDIILPGTLDEVLGHISGEEYDLIYATSYGFKKDWRAERRQDSLGRRFHTITDARRFAKVVNIWFTFISAIIINKRRLEDIPHEDPSAFLNTNLTQLSWTLPLLRHHRRSLVLWNRPLAGRQGNAGGYAIGSVFGEKLTAVTARCLPDRPDLAACMTDPALRHWFPSIIYELRSSGNQELQLEHADGALNRSYGGNFRYWLFAYPVLKLPLPLARLWLKTGEAVSRIIYMFSIPTFWHKQI
jgi:glycosyltransferase involved in cell wall biosynthesis